MRIHRVEQGSAEWFSMRMGIPCTSGFKNVVTPKGAPTISERRNKYRYRLVAERLLRYSMEDKFENYWTLRGKEMEAQAADAFAGFMGVELEDGCFITSDDGRLGCSPDRIVRDSHPRAALEIKCPAPWTHVGYLLDGPGDDYRQQVQGQMMVGEFEAVHFWSWHPQMPPKHIVTLRDDNFIAALTMGLDVFCDSLDEAEAKAREMGMFTPGLEPPIELPGIFPWAKAGHGEATQ